MAGSVLNRTAVLPLNLGGEIRPYAKRQNAGDTLFTPLFIDQVASRSDVILVWLAVNNFVIHRNYAVNNTYICRRNMT